MIRLWNLTWLLGVLVGGLLAAGCDAPPWGGASSQPTSSTTQPDPPAPRPAGPTIPPPPAPENGAAYETLTLIPANAMLAVHARPLPRDLNPDVGGQFDPAATKPDDASAWEAAYNLISQVVSGRLKPMEAVGLRVGEGFIQALAYPYAITILDVEAEPLPDRPHVLRMTRLKLAGLVRCGPDRDKFLAIVQKAVSAATNDEFATIELHEAHGFRYQELRDRRLKTDEAIAWGSIGDHFIIAYGAGAFAEIAAAAAGEAPSYLSNDWWRAARAQRAADTYLELFVNADQIRTGLDPHVDGAATRFFEAWDAGDVRRSHWAFGLGGLSMFCVAHYEISEKTYERVYAEVTPRAGALERLIPPDTNYAVYQLPVGRFLERLVGGLVATRDPRTRAEIERNWARLQVEGKFDAQAGLLANLSERVIMHKFPLHPLRLPFCVTTLIEIRENPREVARTLHAFGEAWQNFQESEIEKGIVAPATLQQYGDGIWFLNFGLAGPAWIVTDKYIVASWGPYALREYLDRVGDAVGEIIRVE